MARHPRSRIRPLGTLTALTALSALVMLALCACWDSAGAQPAAQSKPTAASRPRAKLNAALSLTAGKAVEARALARLIDQPINARLAQEKVAANPRSDDAEFLRRLYLDLVGVIPPVDEVRTFIESKDPERRAKAIEALLRDPRFGAALAEKWVNLMVPSNSDNRGLSTEPLQKWLTDGFNKHRPLNQMVYDLLTASGTQDENGAVTYFIGNRTPDKMTDNVTRTFLGVQLQCAQCHNHPFTDYKQTEYWAMAAFFMKTRVSPNPQAAAKKGASPGVTESTKSAFNKKALPESAKIVPAKFLRGEAPHFRPGEPARPLLAQWVTSDANPYFARAMANRFWFQLFGRGIVNPVDDMHADNDPLMPDVLATLAEQFRLHRYDVRYLVRAICNSEAYQRTSRTSRGSESADPDLYAQRAVRVMAPEQFFDSLVSVLGVPGKTEAKMKTPGKKAGARSPRELFIFFFHVDDANPLEYEVGIPQALRLMNAGALNKTIVPVSAAMKEGRTPTGVIEHLYLQSVSRLPDAAEVQRLNAYVGKHGATPRTYGDMLWALLNSSEFVTNH